MYLEVAEGWFSALARMLGKEGGREGGREGLMVTESEQ